VKAITYSAMQIYDDTEKQQHEVYVIIDIWEVIIFFVLSINE
jgi:hypothetical protein